MKIDCSVLYRNDVKKNYSIFAVNNENEITGDYSVSKKILFGKKLTNLFLHLTLLKNSCVDLIIQIKLTADIEEKIVSIPQYFPSFNFKSLSPVFIFITSSEKNILLRSYRSYAYRILERSETSVVINFFIDAPFLHPSWNYENSQRASTAMPLQEAGTTYDFEIVINEFSKDETFIPVQQFMFPFAQKAAFILTDHCDFDTEKKLDVFLRGNNNNGWLSRKLKITKGVFTLSRGGSDPDKNASLEEEKYKELMQLLYKDGSEIAPHALKSRGQLTGAEFHEAIERLDNYFHPQTWIDHGSFLKYCYSQGGANNTDYLLVETLKKYHYNNLWSFHDVNIEANDTLNIFSTKTKFPFRTLSLSAKYFFAGKWLVSAHYLRSIVHRNYSKNIVIEYLMYAMANTKAIFINLKNKKRTFFKDLKIFVIRLFKFHSFKNNSPVPYYAKDVLRYCSPLYLETHKPLAQYSGKELLLFYTFETTHLPDIYTKKSLDKLIAEYGLHIGHTYILNDLPYINSIFKKKKEKYFLAKKWIEFLNVLSQYVSEKKIWNPNMSEYAAYTLLLQNVKINYVNPKKIEVLNMNEIAIENYTLVVPIQFSSFLLVNDKKIDAVSSDNQYHFFVLNLEKSNNVF